MDIQLTILIGNLIAATGVFYFLHIAYQKIRSEGLRPFGFMCDKCLGKFNKDGTPYIRCLIKPRILKFCGVDIDQKDSERIEPYRFLG